MKKIKINLEVGLHSKNKACTFAPRLRKHSRT